MKHIQRIFTHNALPANQYLVEHRAVNQNGDLIGYVSHAEISEGVIAHVKVLAFWGIAGPGEFDYNLDINLGEPVNQFLDVGFIGDIVVISTKGRTSYHIYREGEYKLNKSLDELPEIQLGITDYFESEDPMFDEEPPPTIESKNTWQEALSWYLENIRNLYDKNKYTGHIVLVAAYRMADNTIIKQSLPFYHYIPITNGMSQYPEGDQFEGYRVLNMFARRARYYIDHTLSRDWMEVIKSIDIFALYIPANEIPETITFLTEEREIINFPLNDFDEKFKAGILQKIDSITLVKPDSGDVIIDEEREIVLKNYQTKENLPPDQLSMHELCFHKNMTYNGRLHIADTLQYLFEGYKWSLPYMNWQEDNNINVIYDIAGLYTGTGVLPYTLEASDFDFIASDPQPILKVTILTEDGERDVYSKLPTDTSVVKSVRQGVNYYHILLPKVFTYPHPGAKKFEICWLNSEGERFIVKSGNFETHDFYSFGYHIFDNPVVLFWEPYTYAYDHLPVPEEWEPVPQPNRLQLSAIENPFYWPLVNSYRIGEDKYNRINDMAIQSTPTSEGQFGQYPLVIFARNGIYLVNQGQDVVYSNVINISNLQANRGVMGIDGAVIFSTKDDLYVLEGRSPSLLSRYLISNTQYTTQDTTTNENPITDPVNGLTFIQSLIFGYDNQHREIVIANPSYLHHYKFSPQGKYFTSATQGYHGFVVKHGSYQGYVISGADKDTLTIYDLCEDAASSDIRVYFKTNPQSLEYMEFKKFLRLGYYCEGKTGDYLNFFVFGENRPEVTFPILQYAKLGAAKDFLYLIAGKSPYSVRYFIYMLSGDVESDSVFHHIETEVVPVLQGRIR